MTERVSHAGVLAGRVRRGWLSLGNPLDVQPSWLHNGYMATFTIRISDELHDKIKTAAAEDRRSQAREIEWLLETGLLNRASIRHAAPRATIADSKDDPNG